MIFGFLLLGSLTAAPEGAAGQLIGVGKFVWSKIRRTQVPTPDGAGAPAVDVGDVGEDRFTETPVQITGVTVQFGGVRPLNDLTLQMSGRIVGIVGPNERARRRC